MRKMKFTLILGIALIMSIGLFSLFAEEAEIPEPCYNGFVMGARGNMCDYTCVVGLQVYTFECCTLDNSSPTTCPKTKQCNPPPSEE
jgi:hypothetical protein